MFAGTGSSRYGEHTTNAFEAIGGSHTQPYPQHRRHLFLAAESFVFVRNSARELKTPGDSAVEVKVDSSMAGDAAF